MSTKTEFVYLDHAAATPLCKRAEIAMTQYQSVNFFNPSAPYLPAVKVKQQYQDAKDQIARLIGAKGVDLVITSSATEANNLAFSAISKTAEVLTLAIEHPSILKVAEEFKTKYSKVNKHGLIDLTDLKQKITDKTELISVALINHELGTIQPLSKISEIVKEVRAKRLKQGIKTPLFLHSDAAQALNLMNLSVARLGVDLMTISSPKIYGPKGVAVLYFSRETHLKPQILGGGQNNGLRSGTENVAGLIGFAAAFEEVAKKASKERARLEKLKNLLKSELQKSDKIIFLGNPKTQAASYLPISVPNLDAERLLFKLEDKNVLVSTGAACSATKGVRSNVLSSIGLTDSEIAGSLRLTLGKLNTGENIKLAAKIILEAIAEEEQRIQNLL